MASKEWAGFTDEDIIRMQRESGTNQVSSEESSFKNFSSQIKSTKLGSGKKVAQKRKARYFNRGVNANANGVTVPEQASHGFHFGVNSPNCAQNPSSHYDTITPVLNVQIKSHTFHNLNNHNADKNVTNNGYVELPSNDFDECTKTDSSEIDEVNDSEANPSETLDVRLNVLEQFELRQKQMEEENAKRTALLAKAIADRKKRTQAETIKLAKIQEELVHLDALLSVDVSVLRNQIEVASLAFSEAEKRYQKAEKEFVDAKMELFKKMERKEQLTEYLCTIIEQNEIRKGRKLAELMEQLEMDSLIQECEVNGMGPLLSQLCVLNDVAYKCCSTIKPPNVKSDIDESKTDSDKEGEKHEECQQESEPTDNLPTDVKSNTTKDQNIIHEDKGEKNVQKIDTEETES